MNRRESGKEPETPRHRGNFPEENNNGLFFKIKNRQRELHKIAVSVGQKKLSIGQNGNLVPNGILGKDLYQPYI